MSEGTKHIEVERKYRVRPRCFATLAARLIEMKFSEFPTRQKDSYLCTDDPKVTRRTRREKRPDTVVHLLTDKRKVGVGRNTNDEDEREITEAKYHKMVQQSQLYLFGIPLIVYKKRVHFFGTFDGIDVTVCLDVAGGPKRMKLGHFVELETMCEHPEQVAQAHKLLKRLAQKVLPKSRQRELRGYRTMLIDRICKVHRPARSIKPKHFTCREQSKTERAA